MRRMKAVATSCLLLAPLIGVGSTWADPPEILTSYKFLPRLSTLRETGGFAGVDARYPVFGTYDFVTGFRYEPRIPADATLTRYAQFTNVNAYGAHPTMDPGLSLDFVFNMSGLDGKPIYKSPSGLELFRFEGLAGPDESPSRVELLAARLGRWMYLRGHTEAPCCDFFDYQLKGIARQVPSIDLDEDGRVGTDDLRLWQDAYGTSLSGRDFLEWQRQHGEEAPSLAEFDALMSDAIAALGASVVAVPEPTGISLMALGVVCSCFGRRFSL